MSTTDVSHAHHGSVLPPPRHPARSHPSGLQGRRLSVRATKPSQALVLLDLGELREYRGRLEAEEDRVSYWRRLVHGKIDVLEADARSEGGLTLTDLMGVLGDTGSGRGRRALIKLRPAEPWPELPVLTEMWTDVIDPRDRGATADALSKLKAAEEQLSTYRRALHERIDESTRELILRYREDPAKALLLLPRS